MGCHGVGLCASAQGQDTKAGALWLVMVPDRHGGSFLTTFFLTTMDFQNFYKNKTLTYVRADGS